MEQCAVVSTYVRTVKETLMCHCGEEMAHKGIVFTTALELSHHRYRCVNDHEVVFPQPEIYPRIRYEDANTDVSLFEEGRSRDEPDNELDDPKSDEERIRAAVNSASEEGEGMQYLRTDTVKLITERVLEALGHKPIETSGYSGPNYMMYLMDNHGMCLLSAPVKTLMVDGDSVKFPPIKVSL